MENEYEDGYQAGYLDALDNISKGLTQLKDERIRKLKKQKQGCDETCTFCGTDQ